MSSPTPNLEKLSINTIRTLSMDGVEAAKSGHPGTPMALAPIAYLLFTEGMRYDPTAPDWPGRDRFVLSCGHASMLLYATLHLAGVRRPGTDELAISLDDIRRFRQLGSPCAGHPEYRHAAGVETTTGPLGQGIGNGVGMAIASRWLGEHYNRPGFNLFDFNVYCLCSDGDLMEGIGGEAASLAGHLALANLCWIYDDNGITIEGKTDLAFSEDVATRFRGYGWNTVEVADANDLDALRGAIRRFHQCDDRPTLVVVKSQIAFGAPEKAGTAAAHGAPLGPDEVLATKAAYGWPSTEPFHVPEGVREHFARATARSTSQRHQWEALFARYAEQSPDLAAEIRTIRAGELPGGWDKDIQSFPADAKGLASRVSSGTVLNQIAKNVPWMLGGSADLAPSTMTKLTFPDAGDFSAANPGGRNFHFGVREHAMGAIANGMVLCGLRAYAATFFVFADYMRPSIRLASIMGLPVLYVFTHDSIGVGEDGPTHEPVEHLAALRAIPGLVVVRPADANEVAEAYRAIVPIKDRPVALVLTRQNLPTVDRTQCAPASGIARGAYVLRDPSQGAPQVILIGTGSEVSLCLTAQERLAAEGIQARVVSMPSWELFDAQPADYRDSVLPPAIAARVAVEAGVEQGWSKYLGPAGRFVGMTGFGTSGPYQKLYEHFGITADAIVAQAKKTLEP